MNKQIFLKWLKINSLCLIGAFIVIFILVQLFPDIMLGFWGGWASLISMTGVKGAAEFSPNFNTFIQIFGRNSISVLIVFFVGLLLVAPIMMVMYGVFYSLVVSLAPLTGVTFTFFDWILVAIELLFFIISATLASTLATEIFGVKPEIKQLLEWWKKQLTDWKNFWSLPEQKRNWRVVFKENKKEFIYVLIIIITLLLLGAWVEVCGY
jgi:uncharacterized membrane protein YecN with MAPEG domain